MDGFQYETELVDHMSGPAGKEAAALDNLAMAAMHAEGAVHKLGSAHEKVGHMSLEAKGFTKEFTGSLVPEIALGEMAAESVKKLGEGALEAAKTFAELTFEGVHFALEMSEFKENAVLAYTVVQGTAEEGERTFEEIDKLGRDIHLPVERAHDLAAHLMTMGLENTREIEGAIQAVSDLQRTGNERGAEKLQSVIERSLASGSLAVNGKTLAGTGIQLPALLEELSKDLHRPVAQIKEELKAGRIHAETGIVAIENVFAKSKIHEIASQKFTLTDVITDMRNSVRGLFQDVDSRPLMDALHNMAWAFGMASEKGGGLKETVTDTFNWSIKAVAPVITAITDLGLEFEIGYLKARIAAKPLTDEIARMGLHVGDLESVGGIVEGMAYNLTRAATAAAYLIAKLEQLREIQDNALSKVVGAVGGHETGASMVDGIVNAVKGGTADVMKAMRDMVLSGISAAKGAADAHSPSRVTFALGSDISEGLELGIGSGADNVSAAMGDVVHGAVDGHGGGKGGRAVTVEAGAIHVEVNAPQAHATADEIREVTESALEDAIERLVLELGG